MKKIDREFFADLAKEVGLNASRFEALGHGQDNEYVVSGDMFERLVDIQNRFERLKAMGDDEYRGFYLELPRPAPEEWDNEEDLIASGECSSHEEFLNEWLAYNPMETLWFHVGSTRYRDLRAIHFTDRKHAWFIITNKSSYADGGHNGEWYREILIPIFDYLQRLTDAICSNPDGFNEYVAHNLPYQQRTGRIARKELCRISPRHRIKVKDRETAIKALEDSVHERSAPHLETMTIRRYCTYYRIAHEAYEAYFLKFRDRERVYEDPEDVPEELRDVAYYEHVKFVKLRELYDIDNQSDFEKFAYDHYGELGLSRLNILARQHNGWVIVAANSYSHNVDLAIDVATALYKAGAPLLIFDAERLLKIMLEEDYVKLVPFSFHNYMGHQEEGTVYELPWEYECSDDDNSELTPGQYHEIVSLAEWDEEERVELP